MILLEPGTLYDISFGLEVSTRYHEWMRARYETYYSAVKFLAILGALITVISGIVAFFVKDNPWLIVCSISGIFIAFVSLVDIGFDFGGSARTHTELCQRFEKLRIEMTTEQTQSSEDLQKWRVAAQSIRKDEPSVYWAIYARAWNQCVHRRQLNYGDCLIPRHRAWLGWVLHYMPDDFPLRSQLPK